MKPFTPKELELKALISSLKDFADKAKEERATKTLGFNVWNELHYSPPLCNVTEFLRVREEWLSNIYTRTNHLTAEMKVELDEYLEAARRLDKAKDNFDDGKEAVTTLRELKDCLESVIKGHKERCFTYEVFIDSLLPKDVPLAERKIPEWMNNTPSKYKNDIYYSVINRYLSSDKILTEEEKGPEWWFENSWSDLASIESGFKCLYNVLSDSDKLLCVTISGTDISFLLDEIKSLISKTVIERKSAIERYIIFEGERASETDIEIWRNIYRYLRAIKKLINV